MNAPGALWRSMKRLLSHAAQPSATARAGAGRREQAGPACPGHRPAPPPATRADIGETRQGSAENIVESGTVIAPQRRSKRSKKRRAVNTTARTARDEWYSTCGDGTQERSAISPPDIGETPWSSSRRSGALTDKRRPEVKGQPSNPAVPKSQVVPARPRYEIAEVRARITEAEHTHPDLVRQAMELVRGRDTLTDCLKIELRKRPGMTTVALLKSIVAQMSERHTQGTDVPRLISSHPINPVDRCTLRDFWNPRQYKGSGRRNKH